MKVSDGKAVIVDYCSGLAVEYKPSSLRFNLPRAYTEFTKVEPAQLNELRRLCLDMAQRDFSDAELLSIAERIVRFLLNSEECAESFDLK